jgi:hypothetical protein
MTIPIEKDIKILSERGTNKSLVPTPKDAPLPYKWKDKEGREAYVIDKKWGAENFMVMDVLAHLVVRKIRENIPKSATNRLEIFKSSEDVKKKETDIKNHRNLLNNAVDLSFEVFRNITGKQWMTNKGIFELLTETSDTRFIVSYPMTVVKEVKETKKGKTIVTFKEEDVVMSWLTSPFELGWEKSELNEQEGKYPNTCRIKLNTIFSELFLHNLLMKTYNLLDTRIYELTPTAQNFYRLFILTKNLPTIALKLETIIKELRLTDKDHSQILRERIEKGCLKPLKELKLICSYDIVKNVFGEVKIIVELKQKLLKQNGSV